MASSTSSDCACFTCKEPNSVNFLTSSYLKKLIEFKLKDESFEAKFFDKNYVPSSCMWINLKELFSEVKKHFSIIKGICIDNISSLKNDFMFISIENLRMDIVKVLNFFLIKVQEINIKYSNLNTTKTSMILKNNYLNNMLMLLLTEIKNLLLFIGHISHIPGIFNVRDFNSDSSKTASYFYHYYHLYLDIWFICLGIIYSISSLLPENIDVDMFCDTFDQSSPFLQLVSLLIYEFTCLSLNRYQNVMYKSLPFPCQCIRDFWIILIHLIENIESLGKNVSFWSIYQSTLQIVTKNNSFSNLNRESSIKTLSIWNIPSVKENSLETCFWITSHLAPLFKYDNVGQFSSYVQPKSGYPTLKYLIHNLLFSSSDIPEKILRNIMSYCIPLVSLWEVSGEILLPFTDLFIKKIEGTFCIQSTDIAGLSYLFKDSRSWLMYVSNLSHASMTGRANSFDRFLYILHIQMKQDVDNNLWRVLKGRIYSKYFPKKIKEISEIGLQNTLSLFLAVAASNQFEINSKICEVVSVVESTAHHRKQLISWKAIFVLLLICREQKQSMQTIVTLISNLFNSACTDYLKISQDSMLKANIMNLVLIYIDNLNEIFKRDNVIDPSATQLITKGFSNLLPSCSISDINYILGVFNSMLRNILKYLEDEKSYEKTHHVKIIEAIFNNIFPFIENISTTNTPPTVVSNIAITLTKIVYIISPYFPGLPQDFYKIFMYFGCRENVNSTITSHYLSSILDCSDIMSSIELKVEDLRSILLQSWLKCTIYMHSKCEYMTKFTKMMLKSTVVNISEFFSFNNVSLDFDDHIQASEHVYLLIEESYNKLNLQKKPQMAHNVQLVFKKYAFYVINKIRKSKESDCFAHVYKLISCLILNCSVVLHHHVTSDHVLLEILDKTIYPQIIFPKDKFLQSLVSSSVKEHLPNILRGLFKLDYRKDKTIEREIRDITIYYISVFPPSNNPIVKLVLDTVNRKSRGLSMDAYQFMLEILKSSFLSNNIEKPVSILEFYLEIFRLTPPDCKKEITNALLKCCLEIFMKRNDSFSENIKLVLKKTLLYYKEKMTYSNTKDILIPIIQWLVLEKLQWSVMRGYSVLDIFVDYLPQLISDMMSFLTTSVETLERNRGIGEDMLLRSGLRNIVYKVQQKLCK